ncbi:MAG: YihA family ribosome biogenesis GTP-binding protein [Deltaproteobacteria bacterium]|nr:MAG: YihA family ribosome biogenesis GTP-binding protein [Deltaproteobacteria bacterium]
MSQDPNAFAVNFQNASFVTSAVKPKGYPPADRPEIAVIGRSNVGKSSLMNSLFQRTNLVKVSKTPGRTQLINFFDVDNQLSVVDLPGYGFAKVPQSVKRQWRPMIESYLTQRTTLVACLLLFDIRRIPSEDDLDMWNWLLHFDRLTVPVATKSDKLSKQKRRNQIQRIANVLDVPAEAIVQSSSKTHAGRDKLRQFMTSLLWSESEEESLEPENESPGE